MPIHLIWGDDSAATEREIARLIKALVNPDWSSINLSLLDGTDIAQVNQSLEEIRTPPFGSGNRVIILKRSPFCNNCPSELAKNFERVLELIPMNTHFVITNSNKPDGRLKTTKILKKLIESNLATEKSFVLPAIWDNVGQLELVNRTAQALSIRLEQKAANYLVEAIGNDSARLDSDLQKLKLHAEAKNNLESNVMQPVLITYETVKSLIEGITTTTFKVGDSLLKGDEGEAISRIDALLDSGEPSLRIIASLTSQIRGWLWVNLLELQGERDVAKIAKAAGINNPKRIYILRKQLQGKQPKQLLSLMGRLLEVEAALKRGMMPKDAFRDGLLRQI